MRVLRWPKFSMEGKFSTLVTFRRFQETKWVFFFVLSVHTLKVGSFLWQDNFSHRTSYGGSNPCHSALCMCSACIVLSLCMCSPFSDKTISVMGLLMGAPTRVIQHCACVVLSLCMCSPFSDKTISVIGLFMGAPTRVIQHCECLGYYSF